MLTARAATQKFTEWSGAPLARPAGRALAVAMCSPCSHVRALGQLQRDPHNASEGKGFLTQVHSLNNVTMFYL